MSTPTVPTVPSRSEIVGTAKVQENGHCSDCSDCSDLESEVGREKDSSLRDLLRQWEAEGYVEVSRSRDVPPSSFPDSQFHPPLSRTVGTVGTVGTVPGNGAFHCSDHAWLGSEQSEQCSEAEPDDEPELRLDLAWDNLAELGLTVPSDDLIAGLRESARRHSPLPMSVINPPPIPGRCGRWIAEPRTVTIGEYQFPERRWIWEDAGVASDDGGQHRG